MARPEIDTYRKQFADRDKPQQYDESEYGSSTYASLLWAVEQQQLLDILSKSSFEAKKSKHLDFACGTGRVLSFLQGRFASSVGIEISPEMVKRAATKNPTASIHCLDITASDLSLPEDLTKPFDMITAFRFFLNAEPDLRAKAMAKLKTMLAGEESILVFNNHGNLYSLKILMWPIHYLRHRRFSYHPAGNYLTHRQIQAMLQLAGLELVARMGCGVLSSKMLPILGFDRLLKLEKALARSPFSRLGANQLYVVKTSK